MSLVSEMVFGDITDRLARLDGLSATEFIDIKLKELKGN